MISSTGLSYLPVDVSLPYSELTLLEMTPPTININIDKMDEREIPITVELEGEPTTGFVSYETKVSPETVVVRAPQSVLNTIEKAVVTLDVTGAQATSTATQTLSFYSANNIMIEDKNLTSVPTTATAKSVVLRKKRVPIVPLLQNSPPAGKETSATVIENQAVDILGDADTINAISFINTAPIDISHMTTTNQRTLSLDIPSNIILEPDIKEVIVNIEVRVTAE
jgi:YbbR domain-containing protein